MTEEESFHKIKYATLIMSPKKPIKKNCRIQWQIILGFIKVPAQSGSLWILNILS